MPQRKRPPSAAKATGSISMRRSASQGYAGSTLTRRGAYEGVGEAAWQRLSRSATDEARVEELARMFLGPAAANFMMDRTPPPAVGRGREVFKPVWR